ncbi:MAG: NTP transferase domain-containing protein [Candidatus Aminicenantes bacterium]|nr:NTP transferase domain-containing protein [Candidatus Aminicenantes bacterium]
MTFFILAAGYGKRAEPLSRIRPKPAFPLDGTPLVRRLLRHLRALGCRKGLINLHHLGDQVVAAAGPAAGIRFIQEEEPSGSRVLRRALPFFSEWLLVVNGDTLFEVPLAEMARRAADPQVDGVLAVRGDASGRYARLLCSGDEFLESAAPRAGPGLMYAGAALFRRRAVSRIDDGSFFSSIRRHRLRFKVVACAGAWLDVGTPASYFQANWDCMAWRGRGRENALCRRVAISSRAHVEHSVLWEGTRIGPGARLSQCIVTGDLELKDASYCGQIVSRLGVFPLF